MASNRFSLLLNFLNNVISLNPASSDISFVLAPEYPFSENIFNAVSISFSLVFFSHFKTLFIINQKRLII